ncbi:hypothetical protein [Aquimarina agarivorans]|uniref:hypothetical protein n=1 Tax=Aquimarina agarivorans TaxID=980584 RepID=UPI000248E687|nr:hypothetical protein [Aquimarina agarivorans]
MKIFLSTVLVLLMQSVLAQGPPITSDKPIMLGGKSFTVKTLTEIRTTQRGTSIYIPLMFHYLPTSNSLVSVHTPLVSYDIENLDKKTALADIQIQGKYQFFRKDGTGKTFRMVVKTLQTLPTGKPIDLIGLSTQKYQGYYGLVSGYETLKYGISSEIGYNLSEDKSLNEMRLKLGFGLPLLKPQYPNKQLNLYFEYTNSWLTNRDWYQLLYAQGVQYALKNITWEVAVQAPLVNDVAEGRKLKYSVFLGTRYTF